METTPTQQMEALLRSLHEKLIRGPRAKEGLEQLISEECVWITNTGEAYSRSAILGMLPKLYDIGRLNAPYIQNVHVKPLADDVVRSVTCEYALSGREHGTLYGHSYLTTVWAKEETRWILQHYQATATHGFSI